MGAPSLDTEFMKYWFQLSPVEKESLLHVAKNYVDIKENAGHVSIEQYNLELEEAMKRMDAGESYTHEQVTEMSKKWLNGKKED